MIQYYRNVIWDSSLSDVGTNEQGLVCNGLKTTTGAPAATPGKFISAALIQNIVDGVTYENVGSTASPSWMALTTSTVLTPVQQQVTVNVSAADLSTLNSVPKILLPALISNTYVVDEILVTFSFGSIAYDFAGNMLVAYSGDTTTSILGAEMNPVPVFNIGGGLQQAIIGGAGTDDVFGALVFKANQDVVFLNDNANPSQGDGTATIVVTYRVF